MSCIDPELDTADVRWVDILEREFPEYVEEIAVARELRALLRK